MIPVTSFSTSENFAELLIFPCRKFLYVEASSCTLHGATTPTRLIRPLTLIYVWKVKSPVVFKRRRELGEMDPHCLKSGSMAPRARDCFERREVAAVDRCHLICVSWVLVQVRSQSRVTMERRERAGGREGKEP